MGRSCFIFLLISLSSTAFSQPSEPHAAETAALQHAAAGKTATDAKDFQKAATEYGKAINLVPNAAEYHIGLVRSLSAANEIDRTWLALRKAARVAPENKVISGLFTNFWNIFDRKGLFNVGEPMQKIADTLGKPDHERNSPTHRRLVYGYHAVDGRNGKIHEILDLRGLSKQHLSPTEFVSVDLDGRGWRCNYRVNNRIVSSAEYVLPGEQIQNWSELVNIQRLHGQAKRGPLKQVVEGMMASLEKSNPDREFHILDEKPASILFEWKTGGNENSAAQHEIVRMFSGPTDVYRIAHVKKVPSIPEEERNKWIAILSAAELRAVKGEASAVKSLSAKPRMPPNAATTRHLAWELGSKLSSAAIMHSQEADKRKTAATFGLAKEAADILGVSIGSLPEQTEDKQKNTIECIQYLLAHTGRELHNQLNGKYDRPHAALLEIAIKSNLLTLLYAPGDSTAIALASAIKERTTIAELPAVVASPLLSSIENEAERRNVVMLVLKMHTDVKLLLTRTAGAKTEEIR